MRRWRFLFFAWVVVFSCSSLNTYARQEKKSISPFEFGLFEAKSGVERFWVLYNTQQEAVKSGKHVDYSGIGTINIDIPDDAKSIPLTSHNDFKGMVLNVTNKEKDFCLFELKNESYPIEIRKKDIDRGVFRDYHLLKKNKCLLCVKDKNPWVENREGYKYGHYRKDILLVVKGKAVNRTVMPYNNEDSSPECYYYLSKNGMSIKGLSFKRTEFCKFKTFLFKIQGVNDLKISDVSVVTPDNDWENDQIIDLKDCANVRFKNLRIDGTYSRSNHSGYGVLMNNIWNFRADNMYGHGNWGVFGTNNVNVTNISNSDINRFDIHCYGKDVDFDHVIFRNRYNHFSSVYGTIRFDNCSFTNFVPVINGTSYNAYVGYDLVFNNCEYSTEHDTPIMINGGRLDNVVNNRRELMVRCLPNVTIHNLTVKIPRKAPNFYLFFFRKKGDFDRKMDYISKISIKGLNIEYKDDGDRSPSNFFVSNVKLAVQKDVKELYEKINIIGNAKRVDKRRGRIVNQINGLDEDVMSNQALYGMRAAYGGMCGILLMDAIITRKQKIYKC